MAPWTGGFGLCAVVVAAGLQPSGRGSSGQTGSLRVGRGDIGLDTSQTIL
jgi:hypothetical protein